VAAYGALANGGMRVEPRFVERIEDATGQVIYQAAPNNRERVLDRRTHARNYRTPRVGVRTWTRFLAYDQETQFRALEYLYSKGTTGGASAAQPFFLTVSFHCPHDPFQVTRDLWALYEDAEVQIPEYPGNMHDTYSAMDLWLNAYHGTDQIDIKDPSSLRELRRSYYGLVSYIDGKVGELVEVLERTGLRDKTIIAFTSDHGDMLAEKNMVQKRSFYEWSSRVPLILGFPGGWKKGTACRQPGSLMDLAPTLLDIAGVRDPLPMDARSLLPCLEGAATAEKAAGKPKHVCKGHHRQSRRLFLVP